MKIGLIGTGMLGNAVGLHLINAGFNLVVFNRTKNKTDELAKHGVEVVNSPRMVAEKSEFVITCVKDADAVKEVSFGENGIIHGMHSNLTIADMSTINPISSREISSEYKKNGIEMLDIPVMGGPNVAINGKLVLMAAGDSKTFEKYKKILETIAHKVFYLGKNGTAHAVKLTMNLQIAMLALSISEGITLARGASVDPKIFLDILNETYFKTGMSENKGYKMIQDEFTPTFTLENLKKDLKTINEVARTFGISLPMTTSAEHVYQQALNKGFGDLDYTGILAYLKSSTNSDNIQN